jgi:hypothetical protein
MVKVTVDGVTARCSSEPGKGEDQPLRRDRLHDGADDVGDARWHKYEVTVDGPIMQAYACASTVSRRSRR